MKLAYQGTDESGNEVADTLEALSLAEARETLRRRGVRVMNLSEVTASPAAASGAPRMRGRTRRLKDLALLARQLAVLVRTGTPLAEAIEAIVRQQPPGPWREVVADVHRQIEQGTSLSVAMARHPLWFDAVCISLISAGESSGQLDNLLERLARLTRQQLKVRRTVIGALIYPALLMVVGVVVVIVMIGFVLPRFSTLFANLDAPLPPSTQILMHLSDLLRGYWWILLGVAVAAAVTAKVLVSTPSGRRNWDAAMVSLPWTGAMVRSLVTARLTRLLGTLLQSQVPMLEALKLVRGSTGNSTYSELVVQAEDAVVRGESLSSALGSSPLISPYVAEAIRHGEQSGQVSPVLLDMASFMDEENEVIVRTMAKLLEPIVLIVLGIIVAIIAISVFMPLFDLTSLTQGGG